MKTWIAFGVVAVYGLSIRLLFGLLDAFVGIMSLAFLGIAPMVIGFLTIILTPGKSTRNGLSAFFKPWLTTLVLLIITIAVQVEGAICWIMIYPFFSILAGLGGYIAYRIRKPDRSQVDELGADWDKPGTLKISFVMLLPLVVGFVESDNTLVPEEITTTREIIIAAPANVVWQNLKNVKTRHAGEKTTGLISILGFPNHLETVTDTLAFGGNRTAFYEKGLVFKEKITHYIHQRLMVLSVNVDPATVSPAEMDEHILIGGKHVNVLEDIYSLTPIDNGRCKLQLSSRYIINTPFNWYAGLWAKLLMSEILNGQLALIKSQSVSVAN